MQVNGLEKLDVVIDKFTKTEFKKIFTTCTRDAAKKMLPTIKGKTPVDTGNDQSKLTVRAMPRSRKWIGSRITIQDQGEADWHAPFEQLGWLSPLGEPVKGSRSMIEGFDACADRIADELVNNIWADICTALGAK